MPDNGRCKGARNHSVCFTVLQFESFAQNRRLGHAVNSKNFPTYMSYLIESEGMSGAELCKCVSRVLPVFCLGSACIRIFCDVLWVSVEYEHTRDCSARLKVRQMVRSTPKSQLLNNHSTGSWKCHITHQLVVNEVKLHSFKSQRAIVKAAINMGGTMENPVIGFDFITKQVLTYNFLTSLLSSHYSWAQ